MSSQSEEIPIPVRSLPGDVLLHCRPVLRNVLGHLPAETVRSVARVSKEWRSAAEATLRDRGRRGRPPALFCWKGKGKGKGYEGHVSSNHHDLENGLRSFVSDLYFVPSLAIGLYSGDRESLDDEGTGSAKGFLVEPTRIDRILPEGCVNLSMTMRGIVHSARQGNPPAFRSTETENISRLTPLTSMLLFSPHPSVTYTPFTIDESCSESDVLDRALAGRVEVLSQIKCVILFSEDTGPRRSLRLLQQVGRATQMKVAIGGAVGDFPRDSREGRTLCNMAKQRDGEEDVLPTSHGIIFAGEGVEAASVLIGQEVKSAAKVELELSRLKKAGLDEGKSCALMFACCGRGAHHYRGKKDVESRVFNKLFPQTPLIGLFGQGEFGVTYIPGQGGKESFSDPGASEKKQKRLEAPYEKDELFHSYCTVFVLLSFK